VGYAGGSTPDPTYRSIGDHSETIQLAFDPVIITYEELLEVFWSSHRPTSPSWSSQYASAIFTHDDAQSELAEASKARIETLMGRMHTRIDPLERFYLAEDYHQKYRCRNTRALYREFAEIYPAENSFRESTAVARVNGYLDGNGTPRQLEVEIDSLGLSEDGEALLCRAVGANCGMRAERTGG